MQLYPIMRIPAHLILCTSDCHDCYCYAMGEVGPCMYVIHTTKLSRTSILGFRYMYYPN